VTNVAFHCLQPHGRTLKDGKTRFRGSRGALSLGGGPTVMMMMMMMMMMMLKFSAARPHHTIQNTTNDLAPAIPTQDVSQWTCEERNRENKHHKLRLVCFAVTQPVLARFVPQRNAVFLQR